MNNRTAKSSAWSFDGGRRCTVEDQSDDLYADDLPTYVAVEELENGYSSLAVLQSPTPHHVQSIIDANELRNEYYNLKKSIVQRAWCMTPYKGCNRFLMCMMVSVDDDSIERWDYEALSKIVMEFGPQFESKGVRLMLGWQNPIKIGQSSLRHAATRFWIQFIDENVHSCIRSTSEVDEEEDDENPSFPHNYRSNRHCGQKVVIIDDFSLLA